MSILAPFISIIYCVCAVFFILRLFNKPIGIFHNKSLLIAIGFAASLLHFYTLTQIFLTPQGMDISIFTILTLLSWLILTLLLFATFKYPVENLAIVIMPLAAFFVLLRYISPQHLYLNQQYSAGLDLHIVLSILSFSLLSIATVQALLLYIQEKHIRTRHPGGYIRALPPLETMESLLLHMISIGFIFLNLSLITGFPYLENIFEQHLVHKTTLTISAWIIFAIFLWGRYQYGWRGRVAIRWTLIGFVILMLGYLGPKFVFELILLR